MTDPNLIYTNVRCRECGASTSPRHGDLHPAPYPTFTHMLGWTCACGHWNRLNPDDRRSAQRAYKLDGKNYP